MRKMSVSAAQYFEMPTLPIRVNCCCSIEDITAYLSVYYPEAPETDGREVAPRLSESWYKHKHYIRGWILLHCSSATRGADGLYANVYKPHIKVKMRRS